MILLMERAPRADTRSPGYSASALNPEPYPPLLPSRNDSDPRLFPGAPHAQRHDVERVEIAGPICNAVAIAHRKVARALRARALKCALCFTSWLAEA